MEQFLDLVHICSERLLSLKKEEKSSAPITVFEAKKSKFPNALDFKRVEDIRSISPKTLVEKYAESTFDELQRRYSFKCVLLPGECDLLIKSYGSEKKAYDNMKQHLLEHLSDLEIRISNGVWPPKQENTEEGCPISNNWEKSSKKLKTEHPFGVKVPKQNVNRRTKKQPKKKCDDLKKPKCSSEIASSSSLKTNLMSSKAPAKEVKKFVSQQGFTVNPIRDDQKVEMIVEEVVQDCTLEMCSPLCCHLDCSRSRPSTSQSDSSHTMDVSSFEKDLIAKISLIHEHSYAALNGVKVEKLNLDPTKNVVPRRRGCCIPPQLIIRTPPFPHVHVPLLPDCSSVEEIGAESTFEQVKTEGIDNSTATLEPNSPPCKDTKASAIKGKKLTKRSRKQNVSSSVLECVENRVDVNASSLRVPNNSCSNDNSVENSENMQKAEREMALRYISKLKSKKKKQYQGSLECRICKDKQFTALATLIHHYRSHAGIKPFACDECDSTFTRQHSLKYHKLIHKGLSRFTCEFCHRTFRHPSHFKEHLRRHTGETPFGCPNCSQKFKTRNTYKRHLKMQHKKLLVSQNIVDLPSD